MLRLLKLMSDNKLDIKTGWNSHSPSMRSLFETFEGVVCGGSLCKKKKRKKEKDVEETEQKYS